MASTSSVSPTFYGHIASIKDALLLFEACLRGTLNPVTRRPHDRERVSLIKSGNVFIYSSGIKRWTDGVLWSPSRILGNFLVYRELERPFPRGEKRRSIKRAKGSPGISKKKSFSSNANLLSNETKRSLIGSLVDSYAFKEEGLIKKTVSVTVGGVLYCLVSYYTVADVTQNKFSTPSQDPRFHHIIIRPNLLTNQNFRAPIDEADTIENRPTYAKGYGTPSQIVLPMPKIWGSSVYGSPATNPYAYEGIPQGANSAYDSQFASSPRKTENYEGYNPIIKSTWNFGLPDPFSVSSGALFASQCLSHGGIPGPTNSSHKTRQSYSADNWVQGERSE
ncbi:hypothetical protein DL98DRAFT_506731 [Cadophora sp. DSE1049]|nr:hypothetical protein DL98DRAFT_506731 [Cadophora sp. DSE1049]